MGRPRVGQEALGFFHASERLHTDQGGPTPARRTRSYINDGPRQLQPLARRPRQHSKTLSSSRRQHCRQFSFRQFDTGANLEKKPSSGIPRPCRVFCTTTAESSPRPAAYSSLEITVSKSARKLLLAISLMDRIRLTRSEYEMVQSVGVHGPRRTRVRSRKRARGRAFTLSFG